MKEDEGQADVEEISWSGIHDHGVYTAEQASLCNGRLRGDFDFQTTTKYTKEILNGTYAYPSNFDQVTKDIRQECARIRSDIPERSVNTVIRRKEWQQCWLKDKETISSSVSELHFSHYNAVTEPDLISHLHALKTLVVLEKRISLGQ